MPDIHITTSFYNKRKGMVLVKWVNHVPNDKDGGSNNSFPGLPVLLDNAGSPIPVSSVPGVTGGELVALEAGTLCEVPTSKLFKLADGVPAIKAVIESMWQGVADEEQTRLNREYKFYGITLDKAVE